MYCKKCNGENKDGSLFCNFCGEKLVEESKVEETKVEEPKVEETKVEEPKSEEPKVEEPKVEETDIEVVDLEGQNTPKRKNGFGGNKKTIFFILGLIVVGAIIFAIVIKSSPVDSAIKAIDKNDFDKASTIYDQEIKTDYETKTEFLEKLETEIDSIFTDFERGKITFKEACEKADGLKKIDGLRNYSNSLKKDIVDLNGSRIAFKSGVEYEEQEKYIDAIDEYKKVKEIDKENYDLAQEKISDLSVKYKEELLVSCDEFKENGEYEKAVNLVGEGLEILEDDEELLVKQSEYKNLLEKQKEEERQKEIEKAMNEQLVTVESTSILVQSSSYKSLYPDLFNVIVKNNSDQTISDYTVCMLGWDKNGFPVKVEERFSLSDPDYEMYGLADNVNILSGETYGKNRGWDLEENHNIVTTKAVVMEVNFYDGTTWDNPYYPYFIEEFAGKPLSE